MVRGRARGTALSCLMLVMMYVCIACMLCIRIPAVHVWLAMCASAGSTVCAPIMQVRCCSQWSYLSTMPGSRWLFGVQSGQLSLRCQMLW